jgi:hypothetical protein
MVGFVNMEMNFRGLLHIYVYGLTADTFNSSDNIYCRIIKWVLKYNVDRLGKEVANLVWELAYYLVNYKMYLAFIRPCIVM